MDDQSFPRAVQAQQQSKRPKTLIILVLFLLLLGGVLFVGSRLLGTDQADEEVESANTAPTAVIAPSDTPAPTEEEEPTPNGTTPTKGPTPTEKKTAINPVDSATGLNRSELSIEVLNGSGVAGVASKMSTFLKDLGYTVSSTGNADNFDYQNVVVRVKSSESSYLPLLKKDLQGSYTVGETSSALASGSADAVVIVGK